ncbi:hypothetical protein HKA89_02280 [Vibrio parahaemolyticus]|uniref:hypothetical protein n=1 Tax=Vibrio parahaemolyticus TaxID=670 RepID=UPI0014699E8A|nr:hypothetical protein [Vibrio parahaemolyticus]MDF5281314.1 hypothetical protein [Vibrio parahaemolyticus]NMU67589.1 hypothetical protein [Vibrio parahaemolyticus]
MQMTNPALPTPPATTPYAVNFKGLIAHLLDILFVDNTAPRSYYAEDLSAHIQKDIGMYR